MTMRTGLLLGSLFVLSAAVLGCEEKSEPEQKTAAAEQAEAPASPEAPKEKSAEELAAEEAAKAEEEKKAAEEAAAQKEVEENPITECCRALGRKGFTERNPDYMAASKACGEAMEAKEGLDKALPGIKAALKSEALPSECSN